MERRVRSGGSRMGRIWLSAFVIFGSGLLPARSDGAECSYSLSSSSSTVEASGGTRAFTVTTDADCVWTAVAAHPWPAFSATDGTVSDPLSYAPWLTVTSEASSSGSGTVSWSAAENTSISPRTGTVTVQEEIHTVTQAGVPCLFSLSSAGDLAMYSGSYGSFTVTTQSGCAWSASSDSAWLTINSGASGSGYGRVSWWAASNPVTSDRAGVITVEGKRYTVFQAAAPVTPDIVLESADFTPAAPAPAQPGSFLNASWTISGQCPRTSFYGELFASKTGGFDLTRFGGTVTQSSPITFASGSLTHEPGDQVLNWLPDGVYTVVACVNRRGTGGPVESNYVDNWAPIPGKRLYVRNTQDPVCDLAWAAPPQATLSPWGIQIGYNFSGVLTNTGTGASPAYGFWIEPVYGTLTPEGRLVPEKWLGGQKVTVALAPGATFNYSTSGYIPEGKAVAFLLDPTDIVSELNEQNNSKLYTTTAPPPGRGDQDIRIESAEISAGYSAPAELSTTTGSLRWSCRIRNLKATDTGPFWIELFASQTGGVDVIRSGVTLTRSQMISNVPAGQALTFSFDQPLNAITDGIYTAVAIAGRNEVAGNPGDEFPADNALVLPGRVVLRNSSVPEANLVWESAPVVTRSGSSVTISGRIRNAGSAASGPFWTETMFGHLDTSGIFASHGYTGSGVYSAGLEAGQSTTYSHSGNVPSGTWTVGVLTDSTDLVPEQDETDNYDYTIP